MPTTGERFERAVSIMAKLRGPGGCPWDREQTFDSIKPYTLEELMKSSKPSIIETGTNFLVNWATCFCKCSFIRRWQPATNDSQSMMFLIVYRISWSTGILMCLAT